jgi:hypothetical protein
MTRQDVDTQKPTLQQVSNLFESWRKTRQKRQLIPEQLWQAAISLSENHSIHQICKTLRLDHSKLKKRICDTQESLPVINDITPSFIELNLVDPPGSVCECRIEIENADGEKMKLHFKGRHYFDPIQLCNAFRSQRQ